MKGILFAKVENKAMFKISTFYRDDYEALSCICDEVHCVASISEVIKIKPDVVVAYFYSWSLVICFLSIFTGSRVILTGGADQISDKVFFGNRLIINRFIAFFCLLLCRYILVVSSEDMKNFMKISSFAPWLKKKIILSNHVITVPTKYLNSKLNFDDSKMALKMITTCWMGSVENVLRKGLINAIDMISDLKCAGYSVHLTIVGVKGVGTDYIVRYLNEINISDCVIFTGSVSEDVKFELYKGSDCYIQLSAYEGLGHAAAEAFLVGLPVVHSNRGGLVDTIGNFGFILDPSSRLGSRCKLLIDFIKSYKPPVEYINKLVSKSTLHQRASSFKKVFNYV